MTEHAIFQNHVDHALRLDDLVAQARVDFDNSKKSAARAAAYIHILSFDTKSTDGKAWLKGAVDAANQAVKAHNDAENLLRDRAKNYAAGTLPANDLVFITSADPEEQAVIAAEKAKLTALAALNKKNWADRKKVPVAVREGAPAITLLVKLVLRFNNPSQSSQVSRYVLALQWIAAQFPVAAGHNVDAIVAAVDNAGGFDAVITAQQLALKVAADADGDDGSSDAEIAKSDRGLIAEFRKGLEKAALQKAPVVAQVELAVEKSPEGYALLIGRVRDGVVDILGQAPVDGGKVDDIVAKREAAVAYNPTPSAEFLHRVLSLGDLIDQGKPSSIISDGTKMGQPLTEQRKLTLRPGQHGKAEVVISARYADASAVIHAQPNHVEINLGPVRALLGLTVKSCAAIKALLAEPADRHMTKVEADAHPSRADGIKASSKLAWVLVNGVLQKGESKSPSKTFYFNDMSDSGRKPLDVENFDQQCAVGIAKSDIASMYAAHLKEWEEVKNAEKGKKVLSLTFRKSRMILTSEGKEDFAIEVTGKAAETVALSFRAGDLHKLMLKLTEAHTSSFSFSADAGGLLCVTWSDDVGRYSVYLPTCTTDARLIARRVGPMRTVKVGKAVPTAPKAVAFTIDHGETFTA